MGSTTSQISSRTKRSSISFERLKRRLNHSGSNSRTVDFSCLVAKSLRRTSLFSRQMPAFVKSFPNIIQRLSDTGVFATSPHGRPNHIILNEYLPGQGIMPHEDGPAYHPVVATISLGSHSVFHYYAYNQEPDRDQRDGRSISATPVLSVLLEPRSAVITTETLYEKYLHGIEEIDVDRVVVRSDSVPYFLDTGTPVQNWEALTCAHIREVVRDGGELPRATRYSLTCRDVAKVRRTLL
ncbi:hypothetical protein BDZ89DRAFT_976698 [Hymenopellis radicata]|nr:hypothetical protein BDZ89DRAFT_976698 [Hymenopellis radicata]